MSGIIIDIEGTDSSGKQTQSELLYKKLLKEGLNVRKISFPNYKSNSSALVKMYLNGQFGSKPYDVNSYTASIFYAIDRFASYVMEWKEFYQNGGIVIADRYTPSNMIHQASKIENRFNRDKFLFWLDDLEYNKMNLPRPNRTIFLNMSPKYSQNLIKERNNKITGRKEKDIHEKDSIYLLKSYKNACNIANQFGWKEINCERNGILKSINKIHKEIYKTVKEVIEK